jgi:hypothetical protein
VVVAGQPWPSRRTTSPRWRPRPPRPTSPRPGPNWQLYQVQLRTAQREYKRLQNLAASNFVAAQRLDAAQDAIAQATANIGAQTAAIGVANAQLSQSKYQQELTVIRAPANGRIARRYANPGAGASTLNVTSMFDLEPNTQRIVRAEIVEADIPNVSNGQEVEIQPESDPTRPSSARSCAAPPSSGPQTGLRRPEPTQRRTRRRSRGQRRQRPAAGRPTRAGQVHEAGPEGRHQAGQAGPAGGWRDEQEEGVGASKSLSLRERDLDEAPRVFGALYHPHSQTRAQQNQSLVDFARR